MMGLICEVKLTVSADSQPYSLSGALWSTQDATEAANSAHVQASINLRGFRVLMLKIS